MIISDDNDDNDDNDDDDNDNIPALIRLSAFVRILAGTHIDGVLILATITTTTTTTMIILQAHTLIMISQNNGSFGGDG